MTIRKAFLERVRHAVVEGNRAGVAPPLPERNGIGYQDAGTDSLNRFCAEFTRAGGHPHVTSNPEAARQILRELLTAKGARKIALSHGGMVDLLELGTRLRSDGFDVLQGHAESMPLRDAFFEADVGISNVNRLVAETGSLVMMCDKNEPRSVSLLPPVHIALAARSQILGDLFDLFALFPSPITREKALPSCLTLITGPSKTGDIELRLVTGVHGPGEIHVLVCSW